MDTKLFRECIKYCLNPRIKQDWLYKNNKRARIVILICDKFFDTKVFEKNNVYLFKKPIHKENHFIIKEYPLENNKSNVDIDYIRHASQANKVERVFKNIILQYKKEKR